MSLRRENKKLRKQLQKEDIIMTKILDLMQSDVDAHAANTAALTAIQTQLGEVLTALSNSANGTVDPAIITKLTKIQDDLGDTSDDVAAAATSSTATAVAAAAAQPETIAPPTASS